MTPCRSGRSGRRLAVTQRATSVLALILGACGADDSQGRASEVDASPPGDTSATEGTAETTPSPAAITRIGVASGDRLASLSADGRLAAFTSDSATLVANDTNGVVDAFVADLSSGAVTRVSVASDGTPANDAHDLDIDGNPVPHAVGSRARWLSSDGTLALFHSAATHLVSDDTNGLTDAFVHDLVNGLTVRVNVGVDVHETSREFESGGGLDSELSRDGRFAVFRSQTELIAGAPCLGIYLYELATHTVTLETLPSGELCTWNTQGSVAISGTGDVLAYDLRNYGEWAYLGVTDRVTHTAANESPMIGGDRIDGEVYQPVVSEDGRWVAFGSRATALVAGDTNGASDVFLRDRDAQTIVRVSVASAGSEADGASYGAAISGRGRFVAFASEATNLVTGDTNGKSDIFVRDREQGVTVRVSLGPSGVEGNGDSFGPVISADGRVIGFSSEATNLLADGSAGAFVVPNPLAAGVPSDRDALAVGAAPRLTQPRTWTAPR